MTAPVDAPAMAPAGCPLQRPLLHLHLSKTGGTDLCAAVRRQGCQTHGINCGRRMYLQDGPWWIPYAEAPSPWHATNFGYPPRTPKNRSCAFRRESDAVFFSVESPLPSLCDGFAHSIILRDPLARAESQARELVRWGILRRHACANYTEWRRVAPSLFDNYYVRMLGGEETYERAWGGLTRDDERRARRVLDGFTLVTTMAAATADFAHSFRLAMTPYAPSPKAAARPCALGEDERAAFRRDNRYDEALYARHAPR